MGRIVGAQVNQYTWRLDWSSHFFTQIMNSIQKSRNLLVGLCLPIAPDTELPTAYSLHNYYTKSSSLIPSQSISLFLLSGLPVSVPTTGCPFLMSFHTGLNAEGLWNLQERKKNYPIKKNIISTILLFLGFRGSCFVLIFLIIKHHKA